MKASTSAIRHPGGFGQTPARGDHIGFSPDGTDDYDVRACASGATQAVGMGLTAPASGRMW